MHEQNCLPDRALEALLREPTDPDRIAAESHLSRCARCRDRFSRLLEASRPLDEHRAPAELVSRARDMVPERAAPTRRWLPLAAAAVLAIGVAVVWRAAPRGGVDDTVRTLPSHATLELLAPAEGGIESGDRALFRWQTLADAGRYEFELVDETGDVVFEAGTTEPAIELTRAHLAVEPGHVYYWSVRALLEDGTLVESKLRGVTF